MDENKSPTKPESPNKEMAPKEDGTKVPLTDGDGAAVEVKFNSPVNGEAKIDLGDPTEFSGLTKEQLMEYSKDPFWVRLRWILFILFWAAWVAMLVIAIVIIVQAPRCKPPPTLQWVQKSPMVEYDPQFDADDSGTVDAEDVLKVTRELDVSSVYIPNLISRSDFEQLSARYSEATTIPLLEKLSEEKKDIVTDFIPVSVPNDHPWLQHENYSSVFQGNTRILDFTNDYLTELLKGVLSQWVTRKHVRGFIAEADAEAVTPGLNDTVEDLNKYLDTKYDGAVSSGAVDMSDLMQNVDRAGTFKQFLIDHTDDWSYFKYKPVYVGHPMLDEKLRLMTLALLLVPGTPIMQLSHRNEPFINFTAPVFKHGVQLRGKDAIKFGAINFLNYTSPDLIAFTRVMKGTPGYAIAVNLQNTNETVNFKDAGKTPEMGTIDYKVPVMTPQDKGKKVDLQSVHLGPFEGTVIQFVPKF